MKRTDIPKILDGTHPTAGRGVALAHQALIFASGLAISIETVPNLPEWTNHGLRVFELTVLVVFVLEYLTRLICAPRPVRYALSFWGVVDLLACLPLLVFVAPELAAVRMLRLMRLAALLKLLHTNRAMLRLETALHQIRGELAVFAFLAMIILYIAAVGIYIFEHGAQPEAFSSIPMSLWWAVVSFTTVGYGDIYPITPEGRIFTTVLLFIGLGVIAVPTALITSALIHSDVVSRVEHDVEEDLRDEIKREVQSELFPMKRKPTRRR
ncbi:ion transporter [Meridianimarinicoccus aquatilis]|uniref:Ion transporter n=1 Tax=Meridianimarinicoccus aquatilis TaxID=2552766 RepID=A0A4R6B4J1_9RHOB|nr:ion transporter [Fluviibacterium aquatile]QIE41442.1 ion transporter [Rhodobacteraceae bacterium SC52]TDL91422.1 ion transporter [Fluviibacterium aquatile]